MISNTTHPTLIKAVGNTWRTAAETPSRARQWLTRALLLTVFIGAIYHHMRRRSSGSLKAPLNRHGATVDSLLDLHPDDKPWSEIQPMRDLVYHSCYDGWQCARLKLPMDWKRGAENDPSVAIAILKIPAKVDITDPRYGGVILINPGGPGGSGVKKIFHQGKRMQDIVDASLEPGPLHESLEEKYFDIVGFDPRGINHSSPHMNCFPDSDSRLTWTLQANAEGNIGSSETALHTKWARFESRSKACLRRVIGQGEDSIGYHINTTPVVRDIIEIVERHGEWREAQARKLLSKPGNITTFKSQHYAELYTMEAILGRTRWKREQEKVLYWGVSYGTFIGVSLAAMFPERIERVLLDSVLLPSAYHNGSWVANLQDTDAILDEFCDYCYQSGPENCLFYQRGSPLEIKKAFNLVHDQIWRDPLPTQPMGRRGPDVITWSDLKALVKDAVYHPIDKFPHMAKSLRGLLERDGAVVAQWKASSGRATSETSQEGKYRLPNRCLEGEPYAPECHNPNEWEDETQAAIFCTDGRGMEEMTKDAFKDYWMVLRKQSSLIGDLWAEYRLMCQGWDLRPAWRYDGPFAAETAHAMLLGGNTIDPVTPIANAHAVAAAFPGSAVLEQRGVGHELLTSPSECTDGVIRRYFQYGELPESGKRCEVNQVPFDPTSAGMGY